TRSGVLGRSQHMVIWRNTAGDPHIWWTVRRRTESRSSMDLAIAGATGVSSGSAHTIPRLLMPDEVSGFSLAADDWFDETRPSEELVDGHACYKITGHYRTLPSERISLWVDKEAFLIRKLVNKLSTTIYSRS